MTYGDFKAVYVDKATEQENHRISKIADVRLTAEANRDKIQYAKRKIILFEGLAETVDVNKIAPVIDKLRDAPESIRAVWNLAHKELKILNANYDGVPCYVYSPPHKGIVLNLADDAAGKDAKPYKHIFHESAHLIDSWMENYNGWRSI